MEKQSALENFKKFLKSDMQIKERLLNLAPTEMDDVDEESRIEYVDRLYNALEEMKLEFIEIVQNFDLGSECINMIEEYFKAKSKALLIGRFNSGICQELYRNHFSCMTDEIIEGVKKEFIGYKIDVDIGNMIQKSKSINELLHVMHSYITNNEKIMQDIPTIANKINKVGEPISLRGENTEIAREIFNLFPIDLDCDSTEIVSVKDKILMMVRGRGHALTINIDTSDESEILVEYFVPIIKNMEMVKALPGVKKEGINNGAIGMFLTDRSKLPNELFEFIQKVPTDLDNPIVKKYNQLCNKLSTNLSPEQQGFRERLKNGIGDIQSVATSIEKTGDKIKEEDMQKGIE